MPVPSAALPLGTIAPEFSLPDVSTGATVSSGDLEHSAVLLVVFICNHCPYVKHAVESIAAVGRDCRDQGVGMVAISSNDAARYPEDGPGPMAEFAAQHGFTFPYLYDESQTVAAAYHAVCTPEPFVFDADRKLVYHGQLDASRPGNGLPSDARDLRAALDAVLAGRSTAESQQPAAGCSIKWKAGNAPVITLG